MSYYLLFLEVSAVALFKPDATKVVVRNTRIIIRVLSVAEIKYANLSRENGVCARHERRMSVRGLLRRVSNYTMLLLSDGWMDRVQQYHHCYLTVLIND